MTAPVMKTAFMPLEAKIIPKRGGPRVCPSLRVMLLRDRTVARLPSGALSVRAVSRFGMLIPCPTPKRTAGTIMPQQSGARRMNKNADP